MNKTYPAYYDFGYSQPLLIVSESLHYNIELKAWINAPLEPHKVEQNITREHLSNTWGVVESKEHADFINELAVNAGFGGNTYNSKSHFRIEDQELYFTNATIFDGNLKQITIPLPPKQEPKWPQVGCEVDTEGGKALLVAGKDDYGMYVINQDGEHILCQSSYLAKPKTADELIRDDLKKLTSDSIMAKYKLTLRGE